MTAVKRSHWLHLFSFLIQGQERLRMNTGIQNTTQLWTPKILWMDRDITFVLKKFLIRLNFPEWCEGSKSTVQIIAYTHDVLLSCVLESKLLDFHNSVQKYITCR